MGVKRRIQKVGTYHLALFLLPLFSILFYGWLKAPELNRRADNPQRFAPLHRRGKILDRNGAPLAVSVGNNRQYPQGESVGSLVGYQLRGRNHTGLEAALQGQLSPPLPAASLSAALQQDKEIETGVRDRLTGPDVSLTVDSRLQKQLYRAMQPLAGAVVVSSRDGEVLAAVSSPSFDPEKVEDKWRKLRADPRSPFIERVGAGLYPVRLQSGESVLPKEEEPGHPWLQDDPFQKYPLSSGGAWIEERLFLTPLMLCQLSYEWSKTPLPETLSLFRLDPGTEAKLVPTGAPNPNAEHDGSVTSWTLDGPAFRNSPKFLATVGTVKQRYFAIVLEEDSPPSQQALTRLLEVLRDYPDAPIEGV